MTLPNSMIKQKENDTPVKESDEKSGLPNFTLVEDVVP